jgi:hypothetical protein
MKKTFILMMSLAFLTACGGEEKKAEDSAKEKGTEASTEGAAKSENPAETPESIAAKWCELNGKAHNATTPEDEDAAKDERKAFEKEMEDKYKDNKEMMDKIEEAVEACEDASEGR